MCLIRDNKLEIEFLEKYKDRRFIRCKKAVRRVRLLPSQNPVTVTPFHLYDLRCGWINNAKIKNAVKKRQIHGDGVHCYSYDAPELIFYQQYNNLVGEVKLIHCWALKSEFLGAGAFYNLAFKRIYIPKHEYERAVSSSFWD